MRKCKGKVNFYTNGRRQEQIFDLGYFHEWGCNYEEFETNTGNYSVAIVELPDGKIITPLPNDIEFIDKIVSEE